MFVILDCYPPEVRSGFPLHPLQHIDLLHFIIYELFFVSSYLPFLGHGMSLPFEDSAEDFVRKVPGIWYKDADGQETQVSFASPLRRFDGQQEVVWWLEERPKNECYRCFFCLSGCCSSYDLRHP